MFRNFLVTALRNIVRHKLYSFINICGLAVGLACAIFIILFVRDELSYDKWIPNNHNLYRLEVTGHAPGRAPLELADTPFPMPLAMKDEFPEGVSMTRLVPESITVNIGDKQFFDTIDVVDPQFLSVIQLPLVTGDPKKALSQPQSLVLSQRLAKKYFGAIDPIGKTVTVGNTNCASGDEACLNKIITLTVTGVLRDLPHNTQLTVDALMPNTSLADRISQKVKTRCWTCFNGYGFLVLAPGANPQTVIRKMPPILDRDLATELREFGIPMRGRNFYDVHLTLFAKVHLNSEQYTGNMTPAGNWLTLYGLAGIGVLIILIACFNYMNLATARAILRAREISLRKCMGATRSQLVLQFLGESVLMTILAAILALALVETLQPLFDSFIDRQVTIDQMHNWSILLIVLAIAIGAGLIGGGYPALILSGFRPAQILRANISGQTGSGLLRAILVVLQFAVSIGLGIATIIVFSQISYARNANLGFQRERIMVLAGGSRLSAATRESFSHTLLSNPGVLDIGLSDSVPFGNGFNRGIVEVPGTPERITPVRISIDSDFTRVYHIRLVAGRMFSRARGVDTFLDDIDVPSNEGHMVIVNVACAAQLGFTPQQAIGKAIIFDGYHVQIVGVLSDIKFNGVREPIEPVVYYDDPRQNSVFSIRMRGDELQGTVGFIDKTWHSFAPTTSPNRSFLDDNFNKLYLLDQRQGQMFAVFVGIAIFIACLGLFGLAAFTVGRRTKEIGIRKVFGARIRDVLGLLLWQFSVPVLIANGLAWPLAWYYLHDWLQGFAYRISMSPLYFLSAGAVALIIAWATVIAHAVGVARANPVHALRYE